MNNFLRKIFLEIYVSGRLYKTFYADGTRNCVGISFEVAKNLTGTPNESNVTIQNANPDTIKTLMACTNREKAKIVLKVGYGKEGYTVLSQGDLIRMFPEKNGTINTFTLTYFDGFSAIQNSHLERSFPAGTLLKDVVLALAESMKGEGVSVDESKVDVYGAVSSRGYSCAGRSATTLDQLASSEEFTWSVQDGVFQAYMDKGGIHSSKKVWNVSVKDRNLIKATPEIGEKYMQQIGMSIEAVLNPKCRCADFINLKSIVYPQYDGKYEIHNIRFTGNVLSDEWKMAIDSKTII